MSLPLVDGEGDSEGDIESSSDGDGVGRMLAQALGSLSMGTGSLQLLTLLY